MLGEMIMYKIAICDDHEHYIKIVKKLLIKQANFPDDVIFYEFSSGEKLLESMREDYNLIFLLILSLLYSVVLFLYFSTVNS